MSLFRTWMFIPGNQQRRIDKVSELDADIFIYDLEDSVPLQEKMAARVLVAKSIENNQHLQNYVRINDVTTPDFLEDLSFIFVKGLKGIVIPKANDPRDIIRVEKEVDELEERNHLPKGSIKLVPLIETALGIHHAYDIAVSSKRIHQMAFGAIDYCLDINAELTKSGMELLYARSQLIVASRAAGIEAPVDTVFLNILDSEGIRKESEYVKQLGFQGKLVIHPNQIPIVNTIFIPTQEEIKEAKEIVSAFKKAAEKGIASLQINGKMVDYPVVNKAIKVCEKAELLGL
jgi:citrate lyase subunit beta / citryl-CoA lyase